MNLLNCYKENAYLCDVLNFYYQGADKRDKITTYIFDHTGYHEIPWFDPYGSNFRPDYGGCSEILEMGDYCIDSKLLKLLVG